MKFLDVGPEPIQLDGYLGNEAVPRPDGSPPPIASVSDFYEKTRGRCRPWAYSSICAVAPVGALFGVWFVASAFFDAPAAKQSGAIPAGAGVLDAAVANAPSAAEIASACSAWVDKSNHSTAPLDAAALHLAIGHVILMAACLIATIFAVKTIRNILAIHRGLTSFLPIILAVVIVGFFATGVSGAVLAPFARRFFGALGALGHLDCTNNNAPFVTAAHGYSVIFDAQARWGVFSVTYATVALGMAAATLAYRFEKHRINERWSDTYVLRHKLKALMTLFLFGSIVLVASNIALSAYADLGAVSAAEWKAAVKPSPASKGVDVSADVAQDGADGAANTAPKSSGTAADATNPKGDEAAPDGATTLRKTLLSAIGALASAILIAMFLPAFAGLTADIELAGKCHAYADKHGDDPPAEPKRVLIIEYGFAITATAEPKPAQNYVAGYKMIEDWKTAHGLALEFSDVATAFAAAAAPLLTNGVFDVAKSIFNVA